MTTLIARQNLHTLQLSSQTRVLIMATIGTDLCSTLGAGGDEQVIRSVVLAPTPVLVVGVGSG